jgi:dsRNA-specific ribonuclease
MLRRSRPAACLKAEFGGHGKPAEYYPRVRPRRLVMPVDFSAPSDPARSRDKIMAAYLQQRRTQTRAKRKGAVLLGEVPEERTVGDAFRLALDFCKSKNFVFRTADGGGGDAAGGGREYIKPAASVDEAAFPALMRRDTEDAADGDGAAAAAAPSGSTALRTDVVSDAQYQVWDMLAATPLSAPVHGALALRGQTFVELTIMADLYREYPRLRSKHADVVRHTLSGILPAARIATSISLVHSCNLESDVGLWRELNYLTSRRDWARRKVAVHKAKVAGGQPSRRLWFYRRHLRAASRLLTTLPVDEQMLHPRLEWLRQLTFSYVAFVEVAEGRDAARNMVRRLFAPELAFGVAGAAGSVLQEVHPLNARADRERLAQQSTANVVGSEELRDAFTTDLEQPRHAAAPPVVVRAIQPDNALREAQLILRYDPSIPAALRAAPIDFVKQFTTAQQMETERYDPLNGEQQRYAPKVVEVKMMAGRDVCVGEGRGATEREAVQNASKHMVMEYYLRQFAPTAAADAPAPAAPRGGSP